MDENYTKNEKNIILKALHSLYNKSNDELELILKESEKKENDSNHILEFTREIKNYDKEFRLKIIKILWQIIYSDNHSDMYESNLMRRLNQLKPDEVINTVKCKNYESLEKQLHNEFKKYRIPQTEYFRLSPALVQQVNKKMTEGANF